MCCLLHGPNSDDAADTTADVMTVMTSVNDMMMRCDGVTEICQLHCIAASERSSGEVSTSESTEESSVTLKGGQTLFIWGAQSTLQPQDTLKWPLWLHPRAPGMLTFHCVWYYEPTTPVEGMKFRSVCHSTPRHCLLCKRTIGNYRQSHTDLKKKASQLRIASGCRPNIQVICMFC